MKRRWFERLAAWCEVCGERRTRHIPHHDGSGRVYLTRYYIALENRMHRFVAVCLHLIRLSDELILHTHPAAFVSVILSGGYFEYTPRGKFWRRPGSVLVRSHHWAHALELKEGSGPVYTLFIYLPRLCDWYFRWVDRRGRGHFIQHDSYLKLSSDRLAAVVGRHQKAAPC